MILKRKIFAIIGSASVASANLQLVRYIASSSDEIFDISIFNSLKQLPHFDPELSINNTPDSILNFRKQVEDADGVLICTPEYVFSIPSGLKNALEWCISTTIFRGKPCGLITASAQGEKGHEELQLIMRTAMAEFTTGTTALIQGIKGKFNEQGQLKDEKTIQIMQQFIADFDELISNRINIS